MYDNNNIFAKILRKELSCDQVYETTHALAFHDLYPEAKIHILVIPKGAYVDFHDFIAKASSEEVVDFYKAVSHVVHEFNLHETGYKLVVNTGKDGGQHIPHFHIHILGGNDLNLPKTC